MIRKRLGNQPKDSLANDEEEDYYLGTGIGSTQGGCVSRKLRGTPTRRVFALLPAARRNGLLTPSEPAAVALWGDLAEPWDASNDRTKVPLPERCVTRHPSYSPDFAAPVSWKISIQLKHSS